MLLIQKHVSRKFKHKYCSKRQTPEGSSPLFEQFFFPERRVYVSKIKFLFSWWNWSPRTLSWSSFTNPSNIPRSWRRKGGFRYKHPLWITINFFVVIRSSNYRISYWKVFTMFQATRKIYLFSFEWENCFWIQSIIWKHIWHFMRHNAEPYVASSKYQASPLFWNTL